MLSIRLVVGVSLLYSALLFLVGYYAYRRETEKRSVIANPHVYSLSIAVFATSWTFYGSVGKAATTGLDFLLVYLGPTLCAFSWWFLLRKIVRIAKENNITSIADFISSRYGKSQWLGALVTVVIILGITPYIAVQLKAVSTTFDIICGHPSLHVPFQREGIPLPFHTSIVAALILSLFAVIFGARRLVSSERHEGLVAAIAFESLVKLTSFLLVGIFVTYVMFDGVTDIFARMKGREDVLFHLTTFGGAGEISYPNWFTTLFLSAGAIIFLPRQFHIMVIENSDEAHIKEAMWRFPVYLFLINFFVVPIALGGIIFTGGTVGADYFVLTLPLRSGHPWLALVAFIGGFSAAAGMVMVESVAVSTMFLNHLVMPIIVKLKPRSWFPLLLINLKRFGIFLVVFLGYLYQQIIGEAYMLVTIGLMSFAAAAQFGPALIGGLYWRRGSKAGAVTGILLGFILWFYTLLIPSLVRSGWWHSDILERGPFGVAFLRPTELFGLAGFDIWTHSLFWSMFFNIAAYLTLSVILPQDEKEREQAQKFVDVFTLEKEAFPWETKRLTKPITILQFANLMAKFIGESQAHAAIAEYIGDREIDERGGVSEFELPKLKRFVEKTLAGSVGAAAAGAIVESYLTDIGSKMESVYDIFSTVRTSLDQSREALYVRLRASEIMSRTLDIRIIMEDLLELLQTEFKFDLAIIRLLNSEGVLVTQCYRGSGGRSIVESNWRPEIDTYIGEAFLANKPQFINDTRNISKPKSREIMEREGIRSFAHIPIASEGEPVRGVLSVFSATIVGLFTEPFLRLLASLAGQLAQALRIVEEREAKERERREKEQALLENARVLREMEIAKQIQLSLLPEVPPVMEGIELAGRCMPATQVGGDYFDFFCRENNILDVVIADVSGHSVGAALIMVETRTVLRAQVNSVNILAVLNDLLYDDLTRAELFITMFYAKYRTDTRVLTYGNAGHNPPIVVRRGATVCEHLDAEGLILGVKLEVEFEEKSVVLQPGDLVLFYTDGVTEAENPGKELFGVDRLCRLLMEVCTDPPQVIIDAVLREVTSFTGSTALQDDISMIVLKVL
jgi:sigma-B regulation protein RsbU (phosphoserine phosphatase)